MVDFVITPTCNINVTHMTIVDVVLEFDNFDHTQDILLTFINGPFELDLNNKDSIYKLAYVGDTNNIVLIEITKVVRVNEEY